MKKTLLVILPLLFLISCAQFKSFAFGKVQSHELNDMIIQKKDFKIIDVRETDEYEQGHIANAISIPYDSGHFQAEYQSLDWGKDTLIVIVDTYENRASNASQILQSSGFTNVKVLTGGMVAWNNKGYLITND